MIVGGTRPDLIKTLILGDIPIALFRDDYMGSWLQKARVQTFEESRDGVSVEEHRANIAKQFPNLNDEQLDSRAIAMSQLRKETSRSLAEGTQFDELDINQVLRDTIAPTLMLQGDDTAMGFLPDSGVEEMRTLFRDFESEKFPGMSHSLDYGVPGAAFRTAVDFLNRRHPTH